MHGIVFAELKKFVETNHGVSTWPLLLANAGLQDRVYMPVQEYPDGEIVALVKTASDMTKTPANAILEAFGEFITPDLLKMYGHLVKPEWKTLDFIQHAEETIHTVVRVKNPGAKPPQLRVTRLSATEIVLHYNSARRMCALAKGIAKGVAEHYKESVTIRDVQCTHKGDSSCEIAIATAAGRSVTA